MFRFDDADLKRWAVGITAAQLSKWLAPMVLRTAFLVTGQRFKRRSDAERAILGVSC